MDRHRISVRTPEQKSLARATSFTRNNVEVFYSYLERVVMKYKFEASDMYNLDETGVHTVHKPPRVLAPKGMRGG